MDELALVRDLAIVWVSALIVGSMCVRLKLPAIAGYVVAGIIIGPHCWRLIPENEQIQVLAELGVALLLFALGVEISLRRIFTAAASTLIASFIQIVGTASAAAIIAWQFGLVHDSVTAFIFGFICVLSSTAVVTKILVDRGEAESTHGRILIPILLLQDLALVPVVALLPALQNTSEGMSALLIALLKAGLLIVMVFVGATMLVPRLLYTVSRANSRELFLLTVISLCLGVAFLSKELGVSLALGAFLSGIMISERPYGHQVLSDIIPLRDLFSTVFFVSVGMLLNAPYIAEHWVQVSVFVGMILIAKSLIAGFSGYIAARSYWTAALVGIGLGQLGEFSFVLATLAFQAKLLPEELYNLVFAAAVVSLILSPAIMTYAPALMARIPQLRLHRRLESLKNRTPMAVTRTREHLILCGFGRMGRSVGLTLDKYKVPFIVIEVNGDIIDELSKKKIPHLYGDAFSHYVLDEAGIDHAVCLVVTVPDSVVAMNIIMYARARNPDLRIIARANHAQDVDLYRATGANAVIQPEFEASIETTRLALIGMRKSRKDILSALRDIRRRGYQIFRPDLGVDSFVEFEHEDYFGQWFIYGGEARSIAGLDVRKLSGATILAVKREEEIHPHPDPELELKPDDRLYVAGNSDQVARFEQSYPVSRFCSTDEMTSNDLTGAI